MDTFLAPPKVLVAPLDWGLGHATRCVPVVQELLRQGCTVVLAAEGAQRRLLEQEFPQLVMLSLPGYGVQYAATAWGLMAKIVAQIPKILLAIKKEQRWLQKVVQTEKIDAVIADNRYGLYRPGVPCVFMTHQLCIKAPVPAIERLLQRINFRYIHKFSECWVPDAPGRTNLAGDLSHPSRLPTVPVHYLGPLSRLRPTKEVTAAGYLLILLSGPEPQRSILEQKMLNELAGYTEPVVLVRGLPGGGPSLQVPATVTVHAHLPSAELASVMVNASLVIGRCGYSTVMDLAVLQKRSLLIPTPGQTEQEYLAGHLQERKLALCFAQEKFKLKPALELAARCPFAPFPPQEDRLLAETVRRFIAGVKTNVLQSKNAPTGTLC